MGSGATPGVRRPWSRSDRRVPRTVVRPLQEFLRWEAAGAVVLLAATVAALVWANVSPTSYEDAWSTAVTLGVGDLALDTDLLAVVNDGLMALFFLVIGLEVKRELVVGELSDRKAAMLPLAAALGGMVLPAAIFVAITAGSGDDVRGWGIPMATDIAFALGVLALLSRRLPSALTAFLLGVAVIDDIGAILVIAVAYTDGLNLAYVGVAVACIVAMVALRRLHVRSLVPYLVLGVAAWAFTAASGVHATIAGVALGLITPVMPFQAPAAVSAEARRIADETADHPPDPDANASSWRRLAWLSRESISPLERVEHALHPWTSFVVLPLFALANAGIVLDRESIDAALDSRITLGVILGLVVGKTLGLTLGAVFAVRSGLARIPEGVGMRHVVGVGAVAGIGFTVSLFIAELAYEDPAQVAAAKIGILVASVLAAVLGAAALVAAGRRGRSAPEAG